jgi:hypothetical protein
VVITDQLLESVDGGRGSLLAAGPEETLGVRLEPVAGDVLYLAGGARPLHRPPRRPCRRIGSSSSAAAVWSQHALSSLINS